MMTRLLSSVNLYPDETLTELKRDHEQSIHSLKTLEWDALLEYPFQKREVILSPWLLTQSLSMIFAPRGVGKTHVSLGIACAVASGSQFLGWEATQPRGVLFVDGEMPGFVLQERLRKIQAIADKKVLAPLRFMTPDIQASGMPNLVTPEGVSQNEPHIKKDIDLIILDNLSTLVRSGRENEAESWEPIQTWALSLRAKGKSVLFIHHSGKNGQQRGTSRREDVLDTVISLNKPQDYRPQMGACFEVHFEKSRFLLGNDVRAFNAQLILNEHNQATWKKIQKIEDSHFDQVVRLSQEGFDQKEIAHDLQMHKSTVSRYVKKARELNLLGITKEDQDDE